MTFGCSLKYHTSHIYVCKIIADNKTVELCMIELTSSVEQLKVSRVLVPGVGSESALLMDNNLFSDALASLGLMLETH